MQTRAIFHIEDDDDYRMLLKVALHAAGHPGELHEYDNATSALAALRTGIRPSLIVLDLNMPGMTGMEFITEIRRDPALTGLPVVVFTTSSNATDEAFCERHGVDMLTKPNSMTAIEDLVAWMVRERLSDRTDSA